MAEGLAHEGDVFLAGGEVAFDPAGALGDGLAEAGGLLVVEDGGGVVGGGETVEGGVEGELVIFGQAVKGPAAPFLDEAAVDVEAGAGEDDVAAAAGAFLVADGVNHGESEGADGGDDVFVGIFRGAIAGGELVAGAVGGEDFFEIVGSEAVVGIENKIGVVGFVLGKDLFQGIVEGVAFALAFGAGADDDGDAVSLADLNGWVLVGFDDDEDVAHGEWAWGAFGRGGGGHDGLLLEAFEETFDDGAFVAGGDEDGDVLRVFAGREVEFLATHD